MVSTRILGTGATVVTLWAGLFVTADTGLLRVPMSNRSDQTVLSPADCIVTRQTVLATRAVLLQKPQASLSETERSLLALTAIGAPPGR